MSEVSLIDPIAAMIAYLKSKSALTDVVGDRIAAKHRYGVAWDKSEAGLVVRAQGGEDETYLPATRPTFEFEGYADNTLDAINIYLALDEIADECKRASVVTPQGSALIYYMVRVGQLRLYYDVGLEMDYSFIAYNTMINKE